MTEKGRYQGQKLSRLWLECNSIEDEIHFMQFCKSIKTKENNFSRNLVFKSHYQIWNQVLSFL